MNIWATQVSSRLDGNIITGPSVLNDPDRFVWGDSVVEGEDGKYHMLYSTWECGDSIPIFSNLWVLHSKIAYLFQIIRKGTLNSRKLFCKEGLEKEIQPRGMRKWSIIRTLKNLMASIIYIM